MSQSDSRLSAASRGYASRIRIVAFASTGLQRVPRMEASPTCPANWAGPARTAPRAYSVDPSCPDGPAAPDRPLPQTAAAQTAATTPMDEDSRGPCSFLVLRIWSLRHLLTGREIWPMPLQPAAVEDHMKTIPVCAVFLLGLAAAGVRAAGWEQAGPVILDRTTAWVTALEESLSGCDRGAIRTTRQQCWVASQGAGHKGGFSAGACPRPG